MKPRSSAEGVVVAAVHARTAAAAAGLRPGDRVLAINGHALRDAIDFRFHGGDELLALSVERDGARHALRLARRPGADLGVELEAPRADEIATCANKCVFCFIHQLPKGMRKSLYVKDDDFRLSFLHGNYITLTDLEDTELRRIEEQRLSPLYVSVHATEPDLRHRLLGQPAVRGELMPRMERLAKAGRPLPRAAAYEGFPILEDGVGLVRRFTDTFARAAGRLPRRQDPPRRVTVVTGEMFAPFLRGLLADLAVPGLDVELVPIANEWFGRGIGVAGLLTGRDIREQLAGRVLGEAVLVPAAAVREGDGVFLDDVAPREVAAALGVPVLVVESTGSSLIAALAAR